MRKIETVLAPAGTGYATYGREPGGADQYGTAATIAAVEALGRAWHELHPTLPFAVGDISRKGGGSFPPHASHKLGIDFDVRPLRNDGQNLPVTFADPTYSRELTRELVRLARKTLRLSLVFFNDPQLISEGLTAHCAGHHNHLHFRLAE